MLVGECTFEFPVQTPQWKATVSKQEAGFRVPFTDCVPFKPV
uniref:Uncharacterized protein n=1 Tax=Anguilla anguilla TaxID=7936 RepID=A0A0E9Q018_ANGAN